MILTTMNTATDSANAPLAGQVAVVTGGSGLLGQGFCATLAGAGAQVALLGSSQASAEAAAVALAAQGVKVVAFEADVLSRASLLAARAAIHARLGRINLLVNAAGGNRPLASTANERSFFELDLAAITEVMDINFHGTVLACQIFGQDLAEARAGCIINISSMAAQRPMTRVAGYAAAKAAVENFTKWLASRLALEYGPGLRVNAIAPGFFRTEQNRYLLFEQDGSPTERAQRILDHTPQQRFGDPSDLQSTLLWLVSPASHFVTGTIVAVDGGFSAFTGV
jgi:NAD(P)-dependent dehydrogenase (short-subunit alcohol dehydrogenase family)